MSRRAFEALGRRGFTVLALILSAIVLLRIPQIRHVLFPTRDIISGSTTMAIVHYGYLLALLILDLWMVRTLVAPRRASSSKFAVRRKIARINDRVAHAIADRGRVRWTFATTLAMAGALGIFVSTTVGYDELVRTATWLPEPPAVFTIGILIVVVAAWLAVKEGLEHGAWIVLGRVFLYATVLLAIGEIIWSLASHFQYVVSFRAYTIWAVTSLITLFVLVARFIDVLQQDSKMPVRFASVVAFAAFLCTFTPARVGRIADDNRGEADRPIREANVANTQRWLAALDKRLDKIPDDGPVILVAASGGGSRAALFTALVLEAMQRQEVPLEANPNYKLGDHTLLISCVSGGSLASAYYVDRASDDGSLDGSHDGGEAIRRPRPWNTERDELVAEMYAASSSLYTIDEQAKAETQEECRQLLEGDTPPATAPWLLDSAFADDMCTDFMAPLLRGVVHFRTERGERVAQFWRNKLGIGTTRTSIDEPNDLRPLLVVNATDVDTGMPLLIGSPPLPQGFFDREGTADSAVRARTLADVDPSVEVDLAEAVRLSANFPWGFAVASLPENESGTTHVVDGGVFDNTGIASLRLILDALGKLAFVENDATARRIVRKLHERGVAFVEIDSGAKPTEPGELAILFSELTEPVLAMQNSSYATSLTAKEDYFHAIAHAMRRSRWTDIRPDTQVLSPTRPVEVLPSIQCNHDENVMTAWALGPTDKARIMVRFLNEWKLLSPKWGDLLSAIWSQRRAAAKVNETTNDDERKKLSVELRTFTEDIKSIQSRLTDMSENRRQFEQRKIRPEVAESLRDDWKRKSNEARQQLRSLKSEASRFAERVPSP